MSEFAPRGNEHYEPEMNRQQFTVRPISPQGLAFGEGGISGRPSSHPEATEVLDRVREIVYSSPDILVAVDVDDSGNIINDDGCGDGRGVVKIFTRDRQFKRSLHRPKVFGGAATMTAASEIGLGLGREKSLNQLFDEAMGTLQDRGIGFGAHTDEHATGDKCGCGAIDRAPEAVMAVLKYEPPIRSALALLGVSDEGLDEVYNNYRTYVSEDLPFHTRYSGRQVMDHILHGANKVVKELGGEHQERRIVLNHAGGFTVNQGLIREATQGRAQIFAVDVWRMNDIASGLYPGEPAKQHQALLSELIYTLAVSAVLTKGDLPVDMIEGEANWATATA